MFLIVEIKSNSDFDSYDYKCQCFLASHPNIWQQYELINKRRSISCENISLQLKEVITISSLASAKLALQSFEACAVKIDYNSYNNLPCI